MSKKSIAQTMKDAGFKPLSRAQQQQNIETLTPVWIEEQNDMTTKTDAARECAEDCAADICHELNIDDNEFNIQNIADQIVKHFPPSVPVVQPEKLEHVHILAKQALVTGDPQELPESADDNDPRQHNCDAMGCPTLDHVLYRLPFTDHREPMVAVKRLKGALETARLRLSTTVPDIYNRRAELLVADLEALIRAEPMVPETCIWSEDEQGEGWHSGCGHRYEFITDGPAENGAKYCCYCGKVLISKALIAEAK